MFWLSFLAQRDGWITPTSVVIFWPDVSDGVRHSSDVVNVPQYFFEEYFSAGPIFLENILQNNLP